MVKNISLEIFVDGEWKTLGEVEIPEKQIGKGYRAQARFQYSLPYLDEYGAYLYTQGVYAASVRYPLDFSAQIERVWPAFLLDLLPTGAARDNWLKRLNLANGFAADFELLEKGAINPPGNIRVKFDGDLFKGLTKHPGFEYQDVVDRGVDFIEYAENLGALVSGTSGAQGVAPKFLLIQDEFGKWHGDGAIPDNQIEKNWLVKFPRGKQERDYQILKAEAQYYEVARDLGVKVKGPLKWDRNTLFIPRFDRDWDGNGKLVRYGLESLISAMGISDFAVSKNNEEYIAVLKRYSSNPNQDIKEFVFRDFLNIVLGNTDNHGRNTALIKYSKDEIGISPLFDFAPMVLDDAGIPRVSKWKNEIYQIPDFPAIYNCLLNNGIAHEEASTFLKDRYERLQNLNDLLEKHEIEKEVVAITTKKYDPFMTAFKHFVGSI